MPLPLFPRTDSIMSFEPVRKQLKRNREYVCELYIRKVKGARFQLRIWLGTVSGCHACSVNCGLYVSVHDAGVAKVALLRQLRRLGGEWTPLLIWQAMQPLIDQGVIPQRVMPMWVKRVMSQGKVRYAARTRLGGEVIESNLHRSPESAHKELAKQLTELVEEKKKLSARRNLFWHWEG